MKALWEAKTTTLVILVIGAMVIAGAISFGRLISTLSIELRHHSEQAAEQAESFGELLKELKEVKQLLETREKQEAASKKAKPVQNLAKKRGTRSEVREFQLAGERDLTLARMDYDRLEGRWP